MQREKQRDEKHQNDMMDVLVKAGAEVAKLKAAGFTAELFQFEAADPSSVAALAACAARKRFQLKPAAASCSGAALSVASALPSSDTNVLEMRAKFSRACARNSSSIIVSSPASAAPPPPLTRPVGSAPPPRALQPDAEHKSRTLFHVF